jgi:hypothetical protein
MNAFTRCLSAVALVLLAGSSAIAGPFVFSTGDPDGRMATASRPSSSGKIEIEAADDFITTTLTSIDHAQFTGLIPDQVTVSQVIVEIYRIFPKDSTVPPDGNVPSRVNSPSDVEFAGRDSASSTLSFLTSNLGPFTASNSVLNGINKSPNQRTGGEGPVTGNEVRFDVTFTTPFLLPADHYFFVPQVLTSNGDFYWLSAPRPIVPPGTPILPDLQSWIRNENIAPDWLRVGTDIIGGDPAPTFNASFSVSGSTVPEPGSLTLFGIGTIGFVLFARRRRIRVMKSVPRLS